jgi:hypothetical protein
MIHVSHIEAATIESGTPVNFTVGVLNSKVQFVAQFFSPSTHFDGRQNAHLSPNFMS